jgi:hypothetical protein
LKNRDPKSEENYLFVYLFILLFWMDFEMVVVAMSESEIYKEMYGR